MTLEGGKWYFRRKIFSPEGASEPLKGKDTKGAKNACQTAPILVLFGSKTCYFSFSTLFLKPNSTKLALIKFPHTAGSEQATAYFTVVVRLCAHEQFAGAGSANS